MRIKKVIIRNFGGIKDREINLSGGFNIIHGSNEAGKSTLQAFIKVMFYGMNSQKKSIRENERKRYLPWTGERASGELHFQDSSGNTYIISRSFGTTRKEDEAAVYNAVTGISTAFKDPMCPGYEIFGIGEEAFEKTLFIRQLGAQVARDKEDEIMKKLINIEESGDDDISYHKAVKFLEEAKKTFTGIRKAGRLDKLKEHYELLLMEKKEALRLQEDNLHSLEELKEAKELKDRVTEEILWYEKNREDLRKSNLLKEYREITDCYERIKEITAALDRVEGQLNKGNLEINDAFLNELRKNITRLEEMNKAVEKKMQDRNSILGRIGNLEEKLEKFKGYGSLDEDIEKKVHDLDSSRKLIEDKLLEISGCKLEIRRLQEELEREKSLLGRLLKFENISEEKEKIIYNYDKRVKELEQGLEKFDRTSPDRSKLENPRHKGNIRKLVIPAALSLMALSVFLSIFTGEGMYLAAIPVSAILMIFLHGTLKREESNSLGGVDKAAAGSLEKELESTSGELKKIFNELGVSSYEEFLTDLRKYNETKGKLDILRARIKDRENQLQGYRPEEYEAALTKNRKFFGFLFEHCGVRNVHEFREGLRLFTRFREELQAVQKQLEELDMSCEADAEKVRIAEEYLKEALEPYRRAEDKDDYSLILDRLSSGLRERNELKLVKASLEDTVRILLKNRTLKEIEVLLQDCQEAENMNLQDEQSIEIIIKRKNDELIGLEKRIKDIENLVNNSFLGRRALYLIEQDLTYVQRRMKACEDKVLVLNMALGGLSQAFEEIQRSFGPRLNSTAGVILERITGGKYRDLRISQDYEIKVIEPMEKRIKEIEYFSNGTWDQVYFALRMAIIEIIFGDRPEVPVILDDAFIQYDDTRLKQVMEYLKDYSKEKQIVLFTCQKREKSLLEELGDSEIISI